MMMIFRLHPEAYMFLSSIPLQTPDLQTALAQSDRRLHFLPFGHFGHDLPPQSMSVSS